MNETQRTCLPPQPKLWFPRKKLYSRKKLQDDDDAASGGDGESIGSSGEHQEMENHDSSPTDEADDPMQQEETGDVLDENVAELPDDVEDMPDWQEVQEFDKPPEFPESNEDLPQFPDEVEDMPDMPDLDNLPDMHEDRVPQLDENMPDSRMDDISKDSHSRDINPTENLDDQFPRFDENLPDSQFNPLDDPLENLPSNETKIRFDLGEDARDPQLPDLPDSQDIPSSMQDAIKNLKQNDLFGQQSGFSHDNMIQDSNLQSKNRRELQRQESNKNNSATAVGVPKSHANAATF